MNKTHQGKQKEVEVKCCPTKNMSSDVMTKPQQGQLFQEMQAIIMNYPVNYYAGNKNINYIK